MRLFDLGLKGYKKETSTHLGDILETLEKRDPRIYGLVTRKMDEIVQFPEHYKPLGNKMVGLRRAHVGTNNVLTYTIDHGRKAVVFQDFGNYDKVYFK